jgi:opacity protein-like surface antigen
MRSRRSVVTAVALGWVLLVPATPARADITGFWGMAPKPELRAARGFALGLNFLVVGVELDFSRTTEALASLAPGLTTTMINGLVQTPTAKTQLYLAAGGGVYQERLGTASETSVGTNVGGGLKISIAGPLRLRLDYRVFRLRGTPREKTPQRAYAGLNLAF